MRFFSDCHSCMPLHGDTDFTQLYDGHYLHGVRYVSLNVGMDMNPLEQVMNTIAGYRATIAASDWLVQAETYADIERAFKEDKLAVSFDLEGALPLMGDVNMVALYHQLGVRQIHLAYNRNNAWAGGAHDTPQGLTKAGEAIVAAIFANRVMMDVSHSSEATASDVCDMSDGHPVIYSHANPSAVYAHGRNVSDKIMQKVAATGGLIGINGVGRFLDDPLLNPLSMVKMIEHTVALVGVEHTAIGLDYGYEDDVNDVPQGVDRSYWWPKVDDYEAIDGKRYIPASGLAVIAEELAKRNYSEAQIDKIMRSNILDLIRKVW